MATDKKYFLLKLNPPRPSFMVDMTEEERQIMGAHVAYWAPYIENGTMLVMGPVLDPAGGYGAGVIRIESETELQHLLANDPANGLGTFEVHQMLASTKF